MTRGLPLLLLAAVYAWAAIGSGLDRLAEKNAAVAEFVPAPFRAAAERSRAIAAIGSANGEAAIAAAEAALEADPADHRGAALLGAAYRLAGRDAAAERAFAVSRQFGWHDPDTQGFWLEERLAQGDYAKAALHLDAILRRFPTLPNAQDQIAKFERDRAGQQALRDRLSYEPPWSRTFWQPETADRETILRRRARYLGDARSGQWRCEQARQLTVGLWEFGLRRDADRVMRAQCAHEIAIGPVADPRFANGERLGWRRHLSGNVTYREGEGGLVVRNRGSATRLVLSQPVALNEGRYRVSIFGAPEVAVSLTCGMPQMPPPVAASRTVRLPDCLDQTLGLWVRGGETATFSAITTAKVSP